MINMKRDGTKYLCYIEFLEIQVAEKHEDGSVTYHTEFGYTEWMVLHWGYPCGLSTTHITTQKWVTFNGFVPKIKKILCYEELFIPRLTFI